MSAKERSEIYKRKVKVASKTLKINFYFNYVHLKIFQLIIMQFAALRFWAILQIFFGESFILE